MDGKSGSFPFQVMTTATTLPDSAFYKINEKQNQIKINQLIMDLASNSEHHQSKYQNSAGRCKGKLLVGS